MEKQGNAFYEMVVDFLPPKVRSEVQSGEACMPNSASDSTQQKVHIAKGNGWQLLDFVYATYVQRDVYHAAQLLGLICDSPRHMTTGDAIQRLQSRTKHYLEEGQKLQLQPRKQQQPKQESRS